MKKKIIFLICLLIFPISVFADHIYDIKMDIYLNQDGSANITEVWDVKANSGSEWYKQLYNLGNMKISNYEVAMDGNPMKMKNWDIDESISEKSGYYGINYVSEGLELCFGKGDMSRHQFTVKYTLSNYIFNVSDAQVLYQTLFPNVTLDSFDVTISSFYEFPDNIAIWGFGGQYLYYPQNGKIYMTSEQYSLNNDYVVALVKFPLGTFNTTNSYEQWDNFDSILNQAQEGTYEYDYGENNNNNNSKWNILGYIFSMLFTYFIPIAIIASVIKVAKNSGYGYKNNKEINKKEVPMFRDIPCNKDVYYANALVKLNNFGYKETNIFGAIILKWIKQNKITFRNETKGIFNRETSSIDLTLNPTFDDSREQELFDIMYKASGDGILEAKELEKWSRSNYSKFFSVFESMTESEIRTLKTDNHIYPRTTKEECKKKNVMDDMIYEDSTKLYGLKKYLEEFSDMKNKEAFEVKLWDEYLMFAYIFGIADKVAKQFKNLYPEVIEDMQEHNFDYDTFIFVNNLSTRTVHAASSARSAAQSYSSGGGGFSSGGGGGGSFGGGGSMGGR